MWIDRVLESRARNSIELSAKFAEQRHRILAENAANIDVPDYQSKRVDVAAFQKALQAALDRTGKSGEKRLELRGDAQVSTDAEGRLTIRAVREPAPNALFHDGTNARLEDLAVDVQQNALSYQLASTLLKSRFDGLLTAIRGRL